jgi:ABC-type multidrug transport system fused ATPase/permease subunit
MFLQIGIVGRTGAGKSSLTTALFRLAEVEGAILIDGHCTRDLNLLDLRRRMSIIPQEPLMFAGTLRNNIDPLEEYDDQDIWDALKQVMIMEKCLGKSFTEPFSMKRYFVTHFNIMNNTQKVKMDSASFVIKNGLDTEISESGTNLSAGEGQLLCLARAILCKPSILIMDEATANIDPQ